MFIYMIYCCKIYWEDYPMSIVLLHLTDWHVKLPETENMLDCNNIYVAKAIKTVLTAEDTKVVFAITGDLTNSGQAKEFKLFDKYLQIIIGHLKEITSVKDCYVFCVPGNHDCNFSNTSITEMHNYLLSQKSDTYNEMLLNSCADVQEQYRNYVKKYSYIHKNGLIDIDTVDAGDKVLFVQMLNTATMSSIHDNLGKLFPISYFDGIEVPKNAYTITLMHHPSNWLMPDNKNDFEKYVMSISDFVLQGHEHSENVYSQKSDVTTHVSCGYEIQNSSDKTDNAFSVYRLNDYKKIHYFLFKYKQDTENRGYTCISQKEMNADVTHATSKTLRFTTTFAQQLETVDIPVSVKNFDGSELKLSQLYCWQTLRAVGEEWRMLKKNVCYEAYNALSKKYYIYSFWGYYVGQNSNGAYAFEKSIRCGC